MINEFVRRINRGILENIPVSGTEIIKELGKGHIKTGKPIVYTSADSVFKFARHEEVITVKKLYNICEIARYMSTWKYTAARLIVGPFIANNANDFIRTK